MKVVAPIAVTESVLALSNVPETAPPAWSNSTTYAPAALVSIATGTQQDVYQSLQAANLNHAPASSPTWWILVGTTYSTYSSGTTYALDDIVIAVATDSHFTYQSLVASNLGNPLADGTKWLNLGATNRWKMFDQSVQSQTQAPDVIDVTMVVPGRIDTVAFLNVDGASCRVIQTDDIEGVVFDQNFTLTSTSGITDSYAYCFTPIERLTSLVVSGLKPYANSTIRAIVSDTPISFGSGGGGVLDFSDPSGSDLGHAARVI